MSLRFFSSLITNTKPINPCVNCLHYIKYKYFYPEDEIYDHKTKLGNCALFGKPHLVTGEIEYDSALECRLNKLKCGKNGLFFIQKDKDVVK
jgi:hypothetical protein